MDRRREKRVEGFNCQIRHYSLRYRFWGFSWGLFYPPCHRESEGGGICIMCQLLYWENRYVSLLHLRREAGWRMCFAVFHYKRSHGPGNTKENGLDDPVCLTVEFLIYFYTKIKSPSRFLTRYLTFYPIVKARLYWYLLTYNISTKQWIWKCFTTLQACYCTTVNQW